jgi:hypothetical protein
MENNDSKHIGQENMEWMSRDLAATYWMRWKKCFWKAEPHRLKPYIDIEREMLMVGNKQLQELYV